jgi:hypothetical protein
VEHNNQTEINYNRTNEVFTTTLPTHSDNLNGEHSRQQIKKRTHFEVRSCSTKADLEYISFCLSASRIFSKGLTTLYTTPLFVTPIVVMLRLSVLCQRNAKEQAQRE